MAVESLVVSVDAVVVSADVVSTARSGDASKSRDGIRDTFFQAPTPIEVPYFTTLLGARRTSIGVQFIQSGPLIGIPDTAVKIRCSLSRKDVFNKHN